MAEQGSLVTVKRVERPIPNPDVSTHPLDDELVLYDDKGGQAYVLNPTAARIWSLCDGARTTTTLAREISRAYQLPYQQALADVRECVQDFQNAGLVSID